MNKNSAGAYRNNARFAGALFLLAMAGSLVGGTMIETGETGNLIVTGVILELLNALAVVGIAAALWVPLKRHYPSVTAGYLGIRLIEAMVCAAAAFVPVVALGAGGSEGLLAATRGTMTAYAVPTFFGIGGTLLYGMLYRARLVPRYISVWGFAASIGIMLVMFVSANAIKPVLGLPIILNEIYLGVYLIAKGFSNSPAKTPAGGV